MDRKPGDDQWIMVSVVMNLKSGQTIARTMIQERQQIKASENENQSEIVKSAIAWYLLQWTPNIGIQCR